MKNIIVFIVMIALPVYFFGSDYVPDFSFQNSTGNNSISKNDLTLYAMSNEQKSDMFFWIAVGTTIASGVGLLMTFPAIGMMAGGYYEIQHGIYLVGTNIYNGGSALLATSQFLFWNGLAATIPMWILYAHFTKKAGKKTIFEKTSFDVNVGPSFIGTSFRVSF